MRPEPFSELRAVTVSVLHAGEMARALFNTYLFVALVSLLIVTPFIAANKPGAFVTYSVLGLASLAAKAIMTHRNPALAIHFFGVFIAAIATIPILILGRHVALAGVVIFSFVPTYAAICGLIPAGVYVGGFIGVTLVLQQVIAAGWNLPVLFPLPIHVQISVVTLCALCITVPLPALFRSMAAERRKAEEELAIRRQKEIELRAAHEEMRKARAAAEAANRAKSTFLANMSHEVRTPMNAIIGLTELALEAGLPEAQAENVATAHNAALNLLKILNEILDLSKIESGKFKLETEPFNLRDLLAEIEALFKIGIREKSLTLTVAVDAAIPQILLGDALRLRQILVNLIGNALKFTSQGSIDVVFEVHNRHDSAMVLQGAVRDTGIGIPAEKQAELFAPFVQADDSITRRFGGTGLGLSITRQLVEQMGGRIAISSQAGVGSCFTFTVQLALPCSSGDESVSANPAASAEVPTFAGHANHAHPDTVIQLRQSLEDLDHLLATKMIRAKKLAATISQSLHGATDLAAFKPVEHAVRQLRFSDARRALRVFVGGQPIFQEENPGS